MSIPNSALLSIILTVCSSYVGCPKFLYHVKHGISLSLVLSRSFALRLSMALCFRVASTGSIKKISEVSPVETKTNKPNTNVDDFQLLHTSRVPGPSGSSASN